VGILGAGPLQRIEDLVGVGWSEAVHDARSAFGLLVD
jgi:hypothetical protein